MMTPRPGFVSRVCSPHWAASCGNAGGRSSGAGRGVFRWKGSALCTLTVMMLVLIAALPSLGATLTVTSLDDDGSSGTLRTVINAASSNDTITFATAPGTILLDCGSLGYININKNLTINGPGSANLAISGNHACTVFVISSGVTVTISAVTIQDGFSTHPTQSGGGIYNTASTLTLKDSTVAGNRANNQGGGISSSGGNVTIDHCSFTLNSANNNGGAIYSFSTMLVSNSKFILNSTGNGGGAIQSDGQATVVDSTLTNNSAAVNGGGIFNTSGTLRVLNSSVSNNLSNINGGGIENGGTMTVMNTTVFHNTANAGRGGGIYNGGTAQVSNSTLADNSAPAAFGAGIYSAVGTLGIKGTIIEHGTTGENCSPAATASSHGYNLSDDNSCTFLTEAGDQNNSGVAGLAAGGPMDNGGPTPTIALTSSSTALDAIPAADCTTVEGYLLTADQRGVSRPQGVGCDMGAFESRSVALPSIIANVCPAGHTTPAPCSQNFSLDYPLPPDTPTVASPTVVTQGAPGLDFNVASVVCTHPPVHCVVGVEFTPLAPGARMGAVQLLDSSSHLLGSTLIYGLGQGPAIAFGPGVQTTLNDSFLGPSGVAIDGQGDVFTTDPLAGTLVQLPAGGGSPVTLSSSLNLPRGVAIDGAGNIFVAESGANQVVKFPAAGGGPVALITGLTSPIGVAVDGAGNLFIAESHDIVEAPTGGGALITPPTVGVDHLTAVAVSANGDLYIADTSGTRVVKLPADGSGQTDVLTGLVNASALAVDAAGDLFIAVDGGVVRRSPNGDMSSIGSGLLSAGGVAVDGAGNVFISDSHSSAGHHRVVELNRSAPPALSYPATNVGSSSAAQSVIAQSIGNEPLDVSILSIGANFAQTPGTGTPADCSSSFTLGLGESCDLSIVFRPLSGGSITSAALFTDNALNGDPAQQSVTLQGTGVSNDFSISASPGTVSIPQGGSGGTTISTALVSGSAETVALSVSGVPSGASALFTPTSVTAGGSSTLTLNAGTAAPNTYSLTVTGTVASATHSTPVSFTIAPPATVNVTVKSAPSGLLFSSSGTGCAPGSGYTTLSTLAWTPGSSCTLAFSTPQAGSAGKRYVFGQWEDSSTNPSRAITAPSSTATYTATFNTQYLLTTSSSPAAGGTVGVSPTVADNYYASGAAVTLTATPAPGYVFSGWTGPVANVISATTTAIMSAPKLLVANFTPALGFAPPSISFGTVTLWGGTSQFLKITNNTSATVKFSKITLSNLVNMTTKDLTYDGGCMSSIAPGKACTVTLSLWPSKTGAATALLNLTGNVSGSPLHVAISATIIAPKAALSASGFSFGNQKTNTASAPRTVTLTNNGVGMLSISGIVLTGSNAEDFAISNNTCGSSLPQGSSCRVSVTFTPHSKNSRSANLKFTDNAQSSTQTVSLSGTGK